MEEPIESSAPQRRFRARYIILSLAILMLSQLFFGPQTGWIARTQLPIVTYDARGSFALGLRSPSRLTFDELMRTKFDFQNKESRIRNDIQIQLGSALIPIEFRGVGYVKQGLISQRLIAQIPHYKDRPELYGMLVRYRIFDDRWFQPQFWITPNRVFRIPNPPTSITSKGLLKPNPQLAIDVLRWCIEGERVEPEAGALYADSSRGIANSRPFTSVSSRTCSLAILPK